MKDPLRTLPGYALRRASAARLNDFSQRLAPLALTFTEASVMMMINANPGATLSAIGRVLDIQRANMTPLIARLEARGLINRVSLDGRAHGLSLSAAGKVLHKQVVGAVDAHEAALIALVPEALRPAVLPVLQALWAES
jgi:DNA-binding MarR family transcriptional regulator